MSYVLTLVASHAPLSTAHLAVMEGVLAERGLPPAAPPRWLKQHKAADLYTGDRPGPDVIRILRAVLAADRIDLFVNSVAGRKKKLLLSDMDSTIIADETLDEMADRIGQGDECRAITEAAMRDEIDLITALRERVSMLRGMPVSVMQDVLERVTYNPGAETLVRGMAQHGATCVLISSGFTFFTAAIAASVGFHHHHGNVLEVADGKLTGALLGDLIDKHGKKALLHDYATRLNLGRGDIAAVGDGSNDLLMLLDAGLGVGFRAKPIVVDSLDSLILYGDLTAMLYAQGLVPH